MKKKVRVQGIEVVIRKKGYYLGELWGTSTLSTCLRTLNECLLGEIVEKLEYDPALMQDHVQNCWKHQELTAFDFDCLLAKNFETCT